MRQPAPDLWWALAEGLGLGWAVGVAVFTSILFGLSLAGVPGAVGVYPAALCTAAGVGLLVRFVGAERRGPSWAVPEGRSVPLLAALGITAAQVALSTWMTLRAPFAAEDSWAFWGLKARMFAGDGLPPGYFHDPTFLYSHPDYPLNLPLAEGTIFRLEGGWGEPLAALFGPACLAALALLFAVGLARLYGPTVAALGLTVLILLPMVPASAASGYADLPLAMYLGSAALYLLLWWRGGHRSDAVVMGLLLGGAIWTKKEGTAVAAVALALYGAGELLRRHGPISPRLRRLGWGIVPALALPLPWELLLHGTRPLGRDFLPLTPMNLVGHLDRLPGIAAEFVLQMLSFAHWSLFWGMVGIVVALTIRRLSWPGYGLLALLTGQLSVYGCSYILSSWGDYRVHIWTSLDRLLLQAVPVALLLLMEASTTWSR